MGPVLEVVEGIVARAGTHPVWGYAHCLRVGVMAEDLARAEGLAYDPEILRAAALLHDIGLYKAYSMREAPDHARRSAVVAERILRDADFPPHATRAVVRAIECHPPGAPPGSSTESALLKDAIALDYLGAIGVSRVFAMVGLEDDVPDMAAAVRHAKNLHRSIPDLLLLESSRSIARERERETRDLLADLEAASMNLKLL